MQKLTAERCRLLRDEGINTIYTDYAELISNTDYGDEMKKNQWQQFQDIFDHICEILESYSRVVTGDLLRSVQSLAKFYAPVFNAAAHKMTQEKVKEIRMHALLFFSLFDQYIDLTIVDQDNKTNNNSYIAGLCCLYLLISSFIRSISSFCAFSLAFSFSSSSKRDPVPFLASISSLFACK